MSIKLIAIDMDGTLLDSQKNLPSEFIPWVKAHPGVQVVIASGRQYYTLEDMFEEIQDSLYFIADNGGLIFHRGEVIYSNEMAPSDMAECLDYFKTQSGCTPILCGAKSAYITPSNDDIMKEGYMYYHHLKVVDDLNEAAVDDLIVKIACYIEGHEAERVFKEMPMRFGQASPVLSGDGWVDIANISTTKGDAAAMLQKQLGISPDESMAFGDYLNDFTLLQNCRESYAMANAHSDLKAIARHIAPSNDENGVMSVLCSLPFATL